MINHSIIELVKKRDNAAFKTMYQNCIRYVYEIVRQYVPNESNHADIIQEIFARVFLRINTFDETKGEFKYWLRRLVINQCLQYHRKNKSSAIIVPLKSAKEIDADDNDFLHELSREDVEKYIQNMPQGYRQVFMLVVIDGYSHQEVSELLGITTETSRSQLSRAKNWLKKHYFTKYNKQKALANEL